MDWKNPKYGFKWNIPGLAATISLLNNVLGITERLATHADRLTPIASDLILLASIGGAALFSGWLLVNIVQFGIVAGDRVIHADVYRFVGLLYAFDECIRLLETYRQGYTQAPNEALGEIQALSCELEALGIETLEVKFETGHAVTFDLEQAPYVSGWLTYLYAMRGYARHSNLEGARSFMCSETSENAKKMTSV